MISKSELQALKPGQKIQIVNCWNKNTNEAPPMDRYLGRIVTVTSITRGVGDNYFVHIALDDEDVSQHHYNWYFNNHCIERIVYNRDREYEKMPERSLLSLFL